jgi:cytochrome c-type biogenesis protein CcmF
MEIGKIGVIVGLVASIASIVLYVLSLRGSRKVLNAARGAYAVAGLSVVFCFGRLMWLVYHHQFQFKYVFEHSSTDLVFPWNIAAAWAGQEGSFLLWAFWTAVIGGLVAWKAGKWESRMMPFYISILTFLFAILAWLSPYALLSETLKQGTGPNDFPMDLPWPPTFGKGMHPTLQNYWMAIHPPTIFFGFAALAVPFCYAIAAMIWREYESWATRVMPWVLMVVATLGIGLFMGGYWAYETQGWHGFWAWDPVENASLFPWLASLALLHGLVVQKSRGGMGRSNIFLAVTAWVLFLYGTYLTRSGVLSNFSVHSFVSLASQPLMLLIVMIASYALLGIGMLIWRWKKIPGRPISDKALSRDTAMVLAVSLMILGTIVVAFGTSFPLLATKIPALKGLRFFDYDPNPAKQGAALLPIFYNKIGSAIMIPVLIIMGMVPFLAWGKTNSEKFLWKILVPWFLALGFGFLIVMFVLGEASAGISFDPDGKVQLGFNPDTPRMLVVALGTLALFAAFANLALGIKLLRVKAVTAGGWLAHVGIGILLVGTVLTNVYEKTDLTLVVEGEKPVKTAFGYSLQYVGWSSDKTIEKYQEASDEKTRMEIAQDYDKQWRRADHVLKLRVAPIPRGGDVAHAADEGHGPGDGHDHGPGETHANEATEGAPGSFIADTRIFRNNMRNSEEDAEFMRWPYIHKEFFRDFYIVCANDPQNVRPSAVLQPGERGEVSYRYGGGAVYKTDYEVLYKRFYMDGQAGQAGTVMRAEVEIASSDGRTATASPGLRLGPNGPEAEPVQIPQFGGIVRLGAGMDAATKQVSVELDLPDAPRRWLVPVAVTNKPMINLVWLGVIVMGIGTFVAMVRRSLEARKGALLETAASRGVEETAENLETVPATSEPKEKGGKTPGAVRPRKAARAKP